MAFPDISNHVVWASTGERINPGNSKAAQGWIVEAPPYQFYNWWQNRVDEALVVLGTAIDVMDGSNVSLYSPGAQVSGSESFLVGSPQSVVDGAGLHVAQSPSSQVNGTASWIYGVGAAPVNATRSFVMGENRYGEAIDNLDDSMAFRSYVADGATVRESQMYESGVGTPGGTFGFSVDRSHLSFMDLYDEAQVEQSFVFGGSDYLGKVQLRRSNFFNSSAETWDGSMSQGVIRRTSLFNSEVSNFETIQSSVIINAVFEGGVGATVRDSFIFATGGYTVVGAGGPILDTFSFGSDDSLRPNTEKNVLFHAGETTSVTGNWNEVSHIDVSGSLEVSGDLNRVFGCDSTLEDMRVAGRGNIFAGHSGWRHSTIGVEGFIDADQCVILGGRGSVEIDADANNTVSLGVQSLTVLAPDGPSGPVFTAASLGPIFEDASYSAIIGSRLSKVSADHAMVVSSASVENDVPYSLALGHAGSGQASVDNITVHLFGESGDFYFAGDGLIEGDLTVDGNVLIKGDTVHVDSELSTADTVVLFNSGEPGSGVTAGFSGLEIDRGALVNYQFGFDEATDSFRVGEIGDLQAVATRSDSLTDNDIAIWNTSSNQLQGLSSGSIGRAVVALVSPSTGSYVRANNNGTAENRTYPQVRADIGADNADNLIAGQVAYDRLPFSADHVLDWNAAYSWGDHSSAGYVSTTGTQQIDGVKTFTGQITIDRSSNHVKSTGNAFDIDSEPASGATALVRLFGDTTAANYVISGRSGATSEWFSINKNSGFVYGAPTGGTQGGGTINAEGLYENGNRAMTSEIPIESRHDWGVLESRYRVFDEVGVLSNFSAVSDSLVKFKLPLSSLGEDGSLSTIIGATVRLWEWGGRGTQRITIDGYVDRFNGTWNHGSASHVSGQVLVDSVQLAIDENDDFCILLGKDTMNWATAFICIEKLFLGWNGVDKTPWNHPTAGIETSVITDTEAATYTIVETHPIN